MRCSGWCATLAAQVSDDQTQLRRRPRSSGSGSSSRSCSAASLVGAPNGSMTISLQLGFDDLDADIARAKRRFRPSDGQSAETAARPSEPSRRICRARNYVSILSSRPALAAAATACDRRDRQRDARLCAGAASGHPHLPAQLWLPRLRDDPPGTGARASDRQGHGESRPARPCPGQPSTAITFRSISQSQIFARHGVEIDRSTLANWVGGACWWLEPLQARLAEHVFASQNLFADDTPIPVLDPGRGRTKTGRLWVYARDDRPWSGPDPPAAVYFYSPDRKAERPASHLARFNGVLQVDGYAGFERLTAGGEDRARRLLGPCATQVLRGASGDRLADRGRSPDAHRRALRDRERDPRPDVRVSDRRCARPNRDRWSRR